jgi:ParB-like chromosome segregation protein Spo0J
MSAVQSSHISLNDLVLIPELSPRARLCEETVIRYMESFESLPPVRIQAGSRVLVDGFHRVEAAVRLGLEAVPAQEESISDDELALVAGLANVQHGQPLSRVERNRLAVTLVRNYGKLREEAAALLGVSPSAVTLALREHQYNELLSEKLGSAVQVINSAHVRALYRVGPDQRERLLEAVVSKVDEDGRPYPLTGAELKLLVDRMLDPATPTAELNRLLQDPKARPRPTAAAAEEPGEAFVPEMTGAKPWEREWESPLKQGDSEAFAGPRAVDEELEYAAGGGAKPASFAGGTVGGGEPASWNETTVGERTYSAPETDQLRDGIFAARRALQDLIPQIQPEAVRAQAEAVLALLRTLEKKD